MKKHPLHTFSHLIQISHYQLLCLLSNSNAKQKHLGCKKVRGQSEATLQTGRRNQKV